MKIARPADIPRAGSDVPIAVADTLVPIDIQERSPRAPVVRPDGINVAGVCVRSTCVHTGQTQTARHQYSRR